MKFWDWFFDHDDPFLFTLRWVIAGLAGVVLCVAGRLLTGVVLLGVAAGGLCVDLAIYRAYRARFPRVSPEQARRDRADWVAGLPDIRDGHVDDS